MKEGKDMKNNKVNFNFTKEDIYNKFEEFCLKEYENYCDNHNIDDVDFDYYGDEFKLNTKLDEINYYLIKLYGYIIKNNTINVQKLTKELIESRDKKYIEFRVDKNYYSKPNNNKLDILLYNKVTCNWFWFEVSTSTDISDKNVIFDRVVDGSYKITSIDYFEID